jgi:regulator of nucleoside diphosphate kinase
MTCVQNQIVLTKSDYELLKKYIQPVINSSSKERNGAEQLQEELKYAKIVEEPKDIPVDVVRLNSLVLIEEQSTGRRLKFKLVLPAEANLKLEKLSVFSPLGIAIIGYREGQRVNWQMPSGNKIFCIKQVVNHKNR